MSVADVDISAVIAALICVAIAMAVSEICDEMMVVIANFIFHDIDSHFVEQVVNFISPWMW